MGTLALALFNSASYYDPKPVWEPGQPNGSPSAAKVVRTFGIVYAMISARVLVWGLYSYQRRVTLIKMRLAGRFGTFLCMVNS